jgi:hypothetical protein
MTRTRIFLAGLAIAAAMAAPSHAQDEEHNVWVRYTNGRFGFSFAYPADVFSVPDPAPDNNSGQSFHTPDGKATIVGFASHNAADDTIDSLWRRELEEVGEKNVTYRKREKSWFVLSGIHPPGEVFYRRREMRKGLLFYLDIKYPEAQKKRFDPIVEEIVTLYRITADGYDVLGSR